MAITPIQRMLVQRTFSQAATKMDSVVETFNKRVVELDPSLQVLIREQRYHQSRKLMQTLAIIVNSLDRWDALIPLIEASGKCLATQGIKKYQYATFGTAMLWTLEKTLGPTFIPDAREAWRSVFNLLSRIATDAAYPDLMA